MKDFIEAALLAFKEEALKKIVFSKPQNTSVIKISARLCAHRGKRILACEYALTGNTVSQKNHDEGEISAFIEAEAPNFAQINLITSAGDAEYKIGKRGAVKLGLDKLKRRLTSGDVPSFKLDIDPLENSKKRILSGSEDFLKVLGISDVSGRVHDKKQAKFRQINKFLEYVDEIYSELPAEGKITVFDLCCGKSYLSFAVYHYLTVIKQRNVYMLGIDLKHDVMEFCNSKARELAFVGMQFITDDITNTPCDIYPDMVISLHACDVATDIVLDTAVRLGAKLILSTPCCHRELSEKISAPELEFVTKYPKLKGTLCDAITDALRLARLEAHGYEVNATELVDPEDTPKNTLIRAIKRNRGTRISKDEYTNLLRFVLGKNADDYIGKINE